jgi:hypothetical protein
MNRAFVVNMQCDNRQPIACDCHCAGGKDISAGFWLLTYKKRYKGTAGASICANSALTRLLALGSSRNFQKTSLRCCQNDERAGEFRVLYLARWGSEVRTTQYSPDSDCHHFKQNHAVVRDADIGISFPSTGSTIRQTQSYPMLVHSSSRERITHWATY